MYICCSYFLMQIYMDTVFFICLDTFKRNKHFVLFLFLCQISLKTADSFICQLPVVVVLDITVVDTCIGLSLVKLPINVCFLI